MSGRRDHDNKDDYDALATSQQFTLAAIVATSSVAYGALLEGGAVAAPDEYSAKVAAQVLKNGGNAVDAAVATALPWPSPIPRRAISAAAVS